MSKDLQTRLDNIIKSLPKKEIHIKELKSLLATNKKYANKESILKEAIDYLKNKNIKIIEETKSKTKSNVFDEILELDDNIEDSIIEEETEVDKEELEEIEKITLNSIPRAIVQYFRDLDVLDTSVLDKETEYEYIRKAQSGDLEARDEFIYHNLFLVVKIAKYYYERYECSLALDDLIQEGNMGLLEALKRFDLSRNLKFSTYAEKWIRSKILRIIATEGRTIKYPSWVVDLIKNVNYVINKFEKEKGKSPTDAEITEILIKKGYKICYRLNINEDYINFARDLINSKIISLNAQIGEDKDSDLGDFIPSNEYSPNTEIERNDLLEKIDKLLPTLLNEKECYIIRQRYGLNPEHNFRTLTDLAQEFGVKHQAVQQMEKRACAKLQRGSVGSLLKAYFTSNSFCDFSDDNYKKDYIF